MAKTKPQGRTQAPLSSRARKEIQQLTLMDNDFMNIALEKNIPCVEEMLRVILKKPDLVVKTVRTQMFFQGFKRSICLDIFAEDSVDAQLDIEMQQADEGADPRRPRFHGSMMDVHALKAGQDFSELPERYVIFITKNDVLGLGQALYTIHKYIDGKLVPFDDGSHLIYVNGAAKDDGSELWKLIHDLQCANPDKMFFPRLAARVRFLKQDKKGVKIMTDYFKKLQEEALNEQQESIALQFIKLGELTLEKIAACTGLTLRRVKALAKTAAA